MSMNIDDWMHASKDEREQAQQQWNLDQGDGEDITSHIAGLFTNECVYKVSKARAGVKDGQRVIEAFSEGKDYDQLKKRPPIDFLGFKVVFNHIDDL